MYLLYEIAGHTFGFVTRAPGLSGRSPQKEPDVFSSCRKSAAGQLGTVSDAADGRIGAHTGGVRP